MLRFINCDDNKQTLQKTSHIIHKIMMKYDFDYRISEFTRYNDELAQIIKSNQDEKVYILDIELPVVSGLEIASEIRDNNDWNSMIIFVSAHPECKDDIFFSRLMALDFISKFYDYDDRLEESLNKVIDIYNVETTLTFNYDYITYRIPVSEIVYIEKNTETRRCIIHTEDGKKYEMVGTLVDLAKKLPPYFYRSHKSCFVNTRKIAQVDYIINEITFKNKAVTDLLSNRERKGLKLYLGEH